ncbi:MAG: winged helix-turn-helix transcriptional regulator [Gemmatimonadaceae bacterium]|nr:winged helix-turn-helix transcriptional regulator [Gemmatimonadaceae bacterium]
MNDLAAIASLVGDPARARIVTALLDGRALTATELSLAAGVAPSTASSHLDRLCRGGILVRAVQGRHRYFRLASADVALALEGLLALSTATDGSALTITTGPRDPELRAARVCYDHLAGHAGVVMYEALLRRGYLGDAGLSVDGEQWAASLGVDMHALRCGSRPIVRRCLDWSERRDHLSGALGAALLERFLAERWVRRERQGRALILTTGFQRFLAELTR